jgi:hypothetical protein
MKKIILTALGLLIALTAGNGLQAYSYNAWGTMTGARTLAVNPFFWGPLKGGAGLTVDAVLLYGVTPRVDLIADIAEVSIAPTAGYALSYLMPRFDLGKNNILALQLTMANSSPASFSVTPQYHFFAENDRLALEFNAGLTIPVSDPAASSVYAVIAPVLKIVPGTLHLFLEVDPSYNAFDGSGSSALNLVPGVWLGLAGGKHQFSFGVPLSDATSGSAGVGYALWYWTTFAL